MLLSGRGAPAARSTFPSDPLATTPRRRATASNKGSNPSSASKRRVEPLGVYLGNWNQSGLPLGESNASYGSRDILGRFNRRISLEHADGHRVEGGNYNSKATACKQEGIDHIGQYRGMTQEQVEAAVSPLREAPRGNTESATPSSTRRRRPRVDIDRSASPTPVRNKQETARTSLGQYTSVPLVDSQP